MITEAGMLTVMRNFACNRFGHVPDNIVRNVDATTGQAITECKRCRKPTPINVFFSHPLITKVTGR